jgi:hypothetical protein
MAISPLGFVSEGYRDGVSTEVVEVAFDVPLGDELFSYEPAPGELVEPKADTFERLSLAKAVARMPFTVLVPTRVPNMDRSVGHIMYRAFRRGGGWSYLLFQYPRGEGFRSLLVYQGRGHDPELDQYEWERVDVANGALKDLRISDPGGDSGSRLVAFGQAGTYVKIQSDLDRERLIDLATSFIPAEEGPASLPD